jgi:hypothetical protein
MTRWDWAGTEGRRGDGLSDKGVWVLRGRQVPEKVNEELYRWIDALP